VSAKRDTGGRAHVWPVTPQSVNDREHEDREAARRYLLHRARRTFADVPDVLEDTNENDLKDSA
jgi:hypothetical protein